MISPSLKQPPYFTSPSFFMESLNYEPTHPPFFENFEDSTPPFLNEGGGVGGRGSNYECVIFFWRRRRDIVSFSSLFIKSAYIFGPPTEIEYFELFTNVNFWKLGWLCMSCLFYYFRKDRSSQRMCSVRKDVLRNFSKFTGKHLCQSLFFNKISSFSLCHHTIFRSTPLSYGIWFES